MQKKWKSKWIKALTSGSYRQARGRLIEYVIVDGKILRPKYCCLGVLARIQGAKFVNGFPALDGYINQSMVLNPFLACGLSSNEMITLAEMNDGLGKKPRHSFREIAAYIKKNIKDT